MNIFRSLDHREILHTIIEERKEEGNKVSFSVLAERVGVQKPYVSRVMAGEACWSADQAFTIALQLALGVEESEYFALLVELERSGLDARKKMLRAKIKQVRRRNLRSKKVLKAEEMGGRDAVMAEYFADPYHSLVHVYLSIPKFQKDMRRLAGVLGLAEGHLQTILKRLEKLGVIVYEPSKDRAILIKPSIHTPANSSLVHAHQALFRALSLDRFVRCPIERKNTYSAVFSGDSSLQETLWAEFLNYLKRVEHEAENPRPANEVFYLQFDLFPWTGGGTGNGSGDSDSGRGGGGGGGGGEI